MLKNEELMKKLKFKDSIKRAQNLNGYIDKLVIFKEPQEHRFRFIKLIFRRAVFFVKPEHDIIFDDIPNFNAKILAIEVIDGKYIPYFLLLDISSDICFLDRCLKLRRDSLKKKKRR